MREKVTTFTKTHLGALVVVAIAVCLVLSAGIGWAKYTTDKGVTTTLNLEVETTQKEYYLGKDALHNVLQSIASENPTSLQFVTGSAVPETATYVSTDSYSDGVQDSSKQTGRVGVFKDGETIYIAPMTSDNKPAKSDSTSVIYAPEDSSCLLYDGSASLTSISCANLDTSNVTNMSGMFRDCSGLTSLDVTNFNTENVTNMFNMFGGCSSLTSLDVSKFDTKNVMCMSFMFCDCSSLTELNVANFNTGKVTDMGSMFCNCSSLTELDLSNFNTSSVTDMGNMFFGCSSLVDLQVASFNTESVTSMSGMFYKCSSLTELDLTSFNTQNVTSMSNSVFGECNKLASVTLGADFSFVGTDGCYLPAPSAYYITGADGNWYDTTDYTGYTPEKLAEHHNALDETRTYVAVPNYTYTLSKDNLRTALASLPTNLDSLSIVKGSDVPTDATCLYAGVQANGSGKIGLFQKDQVVYIAPMTSDNKPKSSDDKSVIYAPADSSELFFSYGSESDIEGLATLKGISCTNLDTSNVTDMSSMFFGCSSLTSLDVSKFNTENVTNMSSMFRECSSLTSLDAISDWDVSAVTNMNGMFSGCSGLTSLDAISGWNINSDMSEMFSYCSNLTAVDLTGVDTSECRVGFEMFAGCSNLKTITFGNSGFTFGNSVTGAGGMFQDCSSLESLDLSNFNTREATNLTSMFAGCSGLKTITFGNDFSLEGAYMVGSMFKDCSSLESLDGLSWNNQKALGMEYMFSGCTNLTLDCSDWYVSSTVSHEGFNDNAPGVTPPYGWQATTANESVSNSSLLSLSSVEASDDTASSASTLSAKSALANIYLPLFGKDI